MNLELTVSMQKHSCYLKREKRDFILESNMSGLTWVHSFSLLQIPCSNVEVFFFFSFIEQSKDESRHFKMLVETTERQLNQVEQSADIICHLLVPLTLGKTRVLFG